MLLVLVNIIWFIIKITFFTLLFLIKSIVRTFTFILKTSFLRFPFLLFTLGYFLHINFNLLATIYFIYLMHLCAIKFNIYKRLYIDLNYISDKLNNTYKVSHYLKSLKNESIILNNVYLESDSDTSCSIDELVITNGGIFAIKTLNYSYNEFLSEKYYANLTSNAIKFNDDTIVDLNLVNKISDECFECYNILHSILSCDIPITNVIALPQENYVIKEDKSITTPIITAKDLPYFIRSNLNKDINYSPMTIKETLLENRTWIFDILISKFQTFFYHSKIIILFFSIFLIVYYIYITFVSYIFLNL